MGACLRPPRSVEPVESVVHCSGWNHEDPKAQRPSQIPGIHVHSLFPNGFWLHDTTRARQGFVSRLIANLEKSIGETAAFIASMTADG